MRQNVQIVLLSDGIETRKGNPVASARKVCSGNFSALEVESLLAKLLGPSTAYAEETSPQISINVIGFGIKKGSNEEKHLDQIASAGNGKYYSAEKAEELTKSMRKATGVVPDDGPFDKKVYKEVDYGSTKDE